MALILIRPCYRYPTNHLDFSSPGAMPELYIAIYQPKEGNYKNWALYLENGSEHTIFEVIGSYPNFERNVMSGKPQSTSRHRKSILVATIRDQDVEDLKTYMANMKVDNETALWTCQDYIIETIDGLYDECIIDEEDEDYKKGKKSALDSHYGAQ